MNAETSLAAASPASDPGGFSAPVLLFTLGSEVFAIAADCVREILDVPPITRVPGAPQHVDGLVNVRGAVVPLADLRLPFEMPAGHLEQDARVIVIEETIAGEREVVGLLADRVSDVCLLDERGIDVPPSFGLRWRSEFLRGIGRKAGAFVIVPDIDGIFRHQAG